MRIRRLGPSFNQPGRIEPGKRSLRKRRKMVPSRQEQRGGRAPLRLGPQASKFIPGTKRDKRRRLMDCCSKGGGGGRNSTLTSRFWGIPAEVGGEKRVARQTLPSNRDGCGKDQSVSGKGDQRILQDHGYGKTSPRGGRGRGDFYRGIDDILEQRSLGTSR